MNLFSILRELAVQRSDEYYVELAENEILVVPVLIEVLTSGGNSEQMRAETLLEKISESNPELVYPYFNFLAKIIKKSDNLTGWSVWKIIANIAAVDGNNRWETVKENFVKSLKSDKIAEFSIVCDCVPKIIRAKPGVKDEVTDILNRVKDRRFLVMGEVSEQCNAVAVEKVTQLFSLL